LTQGVQDLISAELDVQLFIENMKQGRIGFGLRGDLYLRGVDVVAALELQRDREEQDGREDIPPAVLSGQEQRPRTRNRVERPFSSNSRDLSPDNVDVPSRKFLGARDFRKGNSFAMAKELREIGRREVPEFHWPRPIVKEIVPAGKIDDALLHASREAATSDPRNLECCSRSDGTHQTQQETRTRAKHAGLSRRATPDSESLQEEFNGRFAVVASLNGLFRFLLQ
jgi:hypothetical protein